jgi:hypothetical protein
VRGYPVMRARHFHQFDHRYGNGYYHPPYFQGYRAARVFHDEQEPERIGYYAGKPRRGGNFPQKPLEPERDAKASKVRGQRLRD